MRIEELEPNTKVPQLKAQIIDQKEVLPTNHGDLQDCTIEDSTGRVTLTLWRDQAGSFTNGDIIILKDGWCKEYKEKLQVSTGKHGTISKDE